MLGGCSYVQTYAQTHTMPIQQQAFKIYSVPNLPTMTSNNTIDQPSYNQQMQLSNVNKNATSANEVFMAVTYFFG